MDTKTDPLRLPPISTCLVVLCAFAGGCAGPPEPVGYEQTEVPLVAPEVATFELMRYLDPRSDHAPVRLSEERRDYLPMGEHVVRVFPGKRQVFFLWDYAWPRIMGGGLDRRLQFATALQLPSAGLRIVDASADGEGWSVRSTFEEFWSGEYTGEQVPGPPEVGEAVLRKDGVEFPSAFSTFLAEREAAEFVIGNLESRQEALRVVSLLECAMASGESGPGPKRLLPLPAQPEPPSLRP